MTEDLTYKEPLKPIIFAVLVFGAVWLGFSWAMKHSAVRYYYVFCALAVIALNLVLVWSKRRDLLGPQAKKNPKLYIARMKQRAEWAAVGGLVAFVLPYFEQGLAFDRLVGAERLQRISPIQKRIEAVLPPDFCKTAPYSKLACEDIAKDIATLNQRIAYGPERDVTTTIDQISYTLLHRFRLEHNEMKQSEVVDIVDSLHSLVIEDGMLPTLLPVLRLLSMLFAGYAFSSKVALALHEVDGEKARQEQEKKKTISNCTNGCECECWK